MKILREVYLRNDSHLPKHGWLHSCWGCEQITSRTIEYSTVTTGKNIYKFIVYFCPKCQKKIKIKKYMDIFSYNCDEFIEEYLSSRGT